MESTEAPGVPAVPTAILLDGRAFRRAASTTVEQDHYTTRRLRSAGLVAMWNGFDPATDTMPALVERVIWTAFDNGVLYEIVAGMLVEEGIRWSPALASANARIFARLTDPGEKAALFGCIADVLIDFFRLAASWPRTSPKSSARSGGDREAPSDPIAPNDPSASSAATLGTTTANGTR